MSVCSDQREDGESTSGSSEAKTDRYGFLLVNGDTNNDSDDPSPELVRHREMKWITLMNQWDQVLEKKHSKIKAQCQKGIPASVRSRCWPLLCGAKQRKDNNKDLYQTLETSPGQQSWIDVIKRDTDRQFPFHEMFQSKDSPGQQGLLQVLKAYTQFRPDEGYCQAQGPVAAVLLMNMPMEEAFWCLVQISELYLPGYYSPLLEGVLFDAAVLFSVLKRTCPAAYKHMQRQGVEPLMFATDWLMCLYSRHLPFNTLLRVWDLFFCNGVRVLFQVAVVLVRRCLGDARHRKECEGQMETLERLRSVKGHVQHDQADAFIQEVCSVPLSVAELQRQTEKELQKWRKERPGSTFDPRDRCHGYHMIWEKGKEREKENEKKGKQSGTLSVSLMRSQSSLSPAILRKKWRKRGSKAETEEWEGRGFSKQDSDDEEKRRASVCGVAGELRSKTHRTSQDLGTELRKDDNTSTNTRRISGTETQPCPESSELNETVFEEDENDVAVTPIPSHTDNGECEEETRPPSSLKEDDLQTGSSLQDDEEKKVQTHEDDQSEEIPTHQDQPEAETQQEESQPSEIQDEDNARTKPEEETQEDESNQEEGIDNKTFKPEEEAQRNLNVQTEEVNITQQEVEVEVNTDTQKKEIHICLCEQEQENEMNSKDGEEIQIDSSKQEEETGENSQKQQEEIHLGSAEVEAVDNNIKQEKEIQTNSSEQEVEIQEKREIKANSSEEEVDVQEGNEIKAKLCEEEVEKEEENEIKENISEQEVETQEENEMKENISEQEVETQEENEMKENISKQEVETQEENELKENISEQEVETQEENEMKEVISEVNMKEVEIKEGTEIKANSGEQEVEIQNEEKLANIDSEEEKLKSCHIDVDEQQEQEMHSDVQTPEDQQDVEKDVPCVQGEDNAKGEICNRINTDMDMTQEEQESERERSEENEQEAGISHSPGEETEGSVLDEEKRNSNHVLGDEEESETVVSSRCSQPEIEMGHGTESEPAQDSNKEENMEGNKTSTPEHGEPDSTSGNPEAPQPDNKEEEVEIEKQITTESNPVATHASSGSNPNPQLRLRRSSSSHTSYPTILSEDTFKEPQQSIKHEPQTTKAEEHQTTTQPTQTQSSTPEEPETQALPTTQSKSDKPKRRGLFHRLRAEAPSKSTIPKIVIQDFSEGEEKLSSKERRRRRRMQERKEKEEEKERKKLEKELEKEKERVRKKPQTRGRSFQVLNKKHDDGDDAFSGKSDSQTIGRKRNSYSESYF